MVWPSAYDVLILKTISEILCVIGEQPVMKQLQTEAFVFCDDKIYASSMRRNGLYVYDIVTGHSECLGLFKESDPYEWRLHRTAVAMMDDVYFLPDRAKGIHRLNLKTKHVDFLPLDVEEDARFSNGIIIDKTVYCIQIAPKLEIITYDLNNLRQDRIVIPDIPIDSRFINDYHHENGFIYLADKSHGFMFVIDCDKKLAKCEKIIENSKPGDGFGTVCKVKDDFVFSMQKGILVWNINTGKTRLITEYPQGYGMKYRDKDNRLVEINGFRDINGTNEQPFTYSFLKNGAVVLLANRTNMCLSLDLTTDRLNAIKLRDEEETLESLTNAERITHEHFICNLSDEGFHFFSTKSGKIYSFNNSENYSWISINDSEIQWNQARNETLIFENEYYGLEEYVTDMAVI